MGGETSGEVRVMVGVTVVWSPEVARTALLLLGGTGQLQRDLSSGFSGCSVNRLDGQGSKVSCQTS